MTTVNNTKNRSGTRPSQRGRPRSHQILDVIHTPAQRFLTRSRCDPETGPAVSHERPPALSQPFRFGKPSRSKVNPAPSSQTSFARPMPSWVGLTLPSCRMPGVFRYS